MAGRQRSILWLALGALALGAAIVALATDIATRRTLAAAQVRAEATLDLTVQALDGHLRRFETIPALLAQDDAVRGLFAPGTEPAARLEMSRWLAGRNAMLDASEIYVMGTDGVTVAASNHDQPDSFVGRDFSYRPYFTEPMAGRPGRFFALGTTSGIRGYYFSAPVRNEAGTIAGVIVVKVDLEVIEAEWQRQAEKIIISDPEGIVLLSTVPIWRYRSLEPLTADRLARTAATRRYADAVLGELPHQADRLHGVPVLRIAGSDGVMREYLVARQPMPQAGWTVQVLLETADARAQARLAALAAALLFGLGALTAVMLWQRRLRLTERIALQETAKAELEARVEARTADLARVNRLIEAEVAERRETEAALRRTQADLVQAGKLAALGQMSAALSHEINQPLAAARNYADSASVLIDRGDGARAQENVGQIVALIDRVAAIAKHLRSVARKPDQPLKEIALAPAVAEALTIAAPRLTAAGASVTTDLPDSLPPVRGGPVRLQQVLVNVLTNAADAGAETGDLRIAITAREIGSNVHLSVRDHGPGVPAAIADRIFDPFFTTKKVGAGLGLGLSISYNIMKDFGGDLKVSGAEGVGAVFTLVLPVAPAKRLAAE